MSSKVNNKSPIVGNGLFSKPTRKLKKVWTIWI